MKRFSIKKGLFLIGILLVPSILFLVFSLGKHNINDLPVLGPRQADNNGDTIYHTIPDVHLQGADGREFSLAGCQDKIIVLDFFADPCDEKCLKKGGMLANLQNEFLDKENLLILSVSMNPRIPLQDLSAVASKHAPRPGKWFFAKSNEVRELVDASFAGTEEKVTMADLPVEEYILLDQKHRIRGYFNSRILEDNKQLQDAIKVLMREPFIPHKEKNNKND